MLRLRQAVILGFETLTLNFYALNWWEVCKHVSLPQRSALFNRLLDHFRSIWSVSNHTHQIIAYTQCLGHCFLTFDLSLHSKAHAPWITMSIAYPLPVSSLWGAVSLQTGVPFGDRRCRMSVGLHLTCFLGHWLCVDCTGRGLPFEPTRSLIISQCYEASEQSSFPRITFARLPSSSEFSRRQSFTIERQLSMSLQARMRVQYERCWPKIPRAGNIIWYHMIYCTVLYCSIV